MKYLLLLLISLNVFSGTSIIPDKDVNGNIVNHSEPFAMKGSYNFRGTGISCLVAASTTTVCEQAINYVKVNFNGVRITGAKIGDKANLKILDTAGGTYSTVPNFTLNQFGYNWNLTDNTLETLPYPAVLYSGMRVAIEVINSEAISKTVYINFYIHEDTN